MELDEAKRRGTALFAKALGIEIGEATIIDPERICEALSVLFYGAALAGHLGGMTPDDFGLMASECFPFAEAQAAAMRGAGQLLAREPDGNA